MISVITPVYVNDRFMGIAGHDVVLDRIYKDVLDKKIFKSGYSFIFDSDKNIIIHPHYLDQLAKTTEMGKELKFSSLKEKGLADVIAKATRADVAGGSYALYSFEQEGRKYFCYTYRLNLLNWYLASVVPQDELVEMLPEFKRKFMTGAFFCGALILLIVMGIVWFYILSPLKKISRATEIIGGGNLDYKINVFSHDELGKLAFSFNSMVSNLRDRDELLKTRSEELQKTNAELSEHKNNLQRLVDEQTKELKTQNLLLEKRMNAYHDLVDDMKSKLDTVGDAIRIIDKDYTISYVNKSFMDMYSLENERDVIGKKCYEIFTGDACHTENCTLQQILSGKEKLEIDVKRKLPNGEDKIFILSVRPYYSADGDVTGIMEVFKDITVRSELQEMAERNAQHLGRIEMANNVLHDIGNALTGISACMLKPQAQKDWVEIKSLHQLKDLFITSEKLLAAALGENKSRKLISFIDALAASFEKRSASHTEFFEKISRAIGHISSVLDLQRHYMKEKSTPLASDISLKNMIEDTLVMLAGSQEKRDIQIKMNFRGENPKVSGDQTRLIRVFLNIIKNIYEAFDSAESAETKILSINTESDHEKNEVSIVFTDNACGFLPELAEQLFDRGFTTKEKGSGIGLHECRSIIESHGGTIKIESKGKNTGATVTIILPLLKTKQGKMNNGTAF